MQTTQSKKITTSAVVTVAGVPGQLYALTLHSGTTDSSITIKNGGAAGTDLWGLSLNGTTVAGETTESIAFTMPIGGAIDLYATLAGAGAVAYVSFMESGENY